MRVLVFGFALLAALVLAWSRFPVEGDGVAEVLPVQKFSGDNALVLGNLAFEQEFSFSFWAMGVGVNPDWAVLLDYRHKSDKSFAVHQKGSEQNVFAFGIHAADGVQGVYFRLEPQVWHHIAVVKSRGRLAAFVDGKIVDESRFKDDFVIAYGGDELLTVGGWGYGGRRWLGSMACLQVFRSAISLDKISRLASDKACKLS